MPDKHAIKIKSAILCDDIRQEKNNKLILIGVFSGNIMLHDFPGMIAPQIYIEWVLDRPGEHKFTIKYELGGEKRKEIKGNYKLLESNEVASLVLPPVLLEIERPTKLDVVLRLDDGSPINILTKKIVAAELSEPAVSETPSAQSLSAAPATDS